MSDTTYEVFVRDWWHVDRYTGKRTPYPGAPEEQLATGLSREEALALCDEYNEANDPGPESRKAEFRAE